MTTDLAFSTSDNGTDGELTTSHEPTGEDASEVYNAEAGMGGDRSQLTSTAQVSEFLTRLQSGTSLDRLSPPVISDAEWDAQSDSEKMRVHQVFADLGVRHVRIERSSKRYVDQPIGRFHTFIPKLFGFTFYRTEVSEDPSYVDTFIDYLAENASGQSRQWGRVTIFGRNPKNDNQSDEYAIQMSSIVPPVGFIQWDLKDWGDRAGFTPGSVGILESVKTGKSKFVGFMTHSADFSTGLSEQQGVTLDGTCTFPYGREPPDKAPYQVDCQQRLSRGPATQSSEQSGGNRPSFNTAITAYHGALAKRFRTPAMSAFEVAGHCDNSARDVRDATEEQLSEFIEQGKRAIGDKNPFTDVIAVTAKSSQQEDDGHWDGCRTIRVKTSLDGDPEGKTWAPPRSLTRGVPSETSRTSIGTRNNQAAEEDDWRTKDLRMYLVYSSI